MRIRTVVKIVTVFMGISVMSARVQAGQQYFSGTGHWYEAVCAPQGITWDGAYTDAQTRGGHLATVHSEEENQFILGLVNDSRYWNTDPAHTPWGPWLGGFQASGSPEPSAGWQWVTGESFSYSNWRPPQPDNGAGIENHLHVYDNFPDGSGRWNDLCGTWALNSYIVEYEPLAAPSGFEQNCWTDVVTATAEITDLLLPYLAKSAGVTLGTMGPLTIDVEMLRQADEQLGQLLGVDSMMLSPDYGPILTVACPVDVVITDPQGNRLSSTVSEIQGAQHWEAAAVEGGELMEFVMFDKDVQLDDGYLIEVIPEAGADPDATFSVFLYDPANEQCIILEPEAQVGTSGAIYTVPEPAALSLLAFGSLAVLKRKRR